MSFTLPGRYSDTIVDRFAKPFRSRRVLVFVAGTSTSATLYADTARTSLANPPLTDDDGNLEFFAEPGDYDFLYNGGRVRQRVHPAPAELDSRLVALEATAGGSIAGLSGEAAARVAGDAALAAQDAAEAALRASGDSSEASTRIAQDAANAAATAAEAARAAAAEGNEATARAAAVTAETSRATAAEAAINAQIAALPGTYAPLDDARITGAQQTSGKNAAGGYVGLNGSGLVDSSRLPAGALGVPATVGASAPVSPSVNDLWFVDVPTSDPLSMGLTWHTLYWADKESYADGASMAAGATDQSGNGRVCSPVSGYAPPTFRRIARDLNSRAAYEFDNATQQVLQRLGTTTLNMPLTIVAVGYVSAAGMVLHDGQPNYQKKLYRTGSVWSMKGSGPVAGLGATTADALPHCFFEEWNSPSSLLRIDRAQQGAAGDTSSSNFRGFTIGADYNFTAPSFLSGRVAFLGVVSGLLSTAQRNAIEAWAQAYYAMA